jgi:hypothetical protein
MTKLYQVPIDNIENRSIRWQPKSKRWTFRVVTERCNEIVQTEAVSMDSDGVVWFIPDVGFCTSCESSCNVKVTEKKWK